MILELQNITFGFSPEKQILKDLSLSLEEKKIYSLMGSNGAGKTTLFNIVSGFIKPQNGDIIFDNKKITNLQPHKINQYGISRTFQDLRLIKNLSVKENIVLAMHRNPTDNWFKAMLPQSTYSSALKVFQDKADMIIERFFLNDVKDSLASEISYGQQKLLTLACCVANGATFLLIDEAVAGIQPEYCKKMVNLIKQLRNQGITILLIEHNTDFIEEVSEKILFLHEGKITTFENMESLKADKVVLEAYI